MIQLQRLLDGGTLGTWAEPSKLPPQVPRNMLQFQGDHDGGTLGTLGTLAIEHGAKYLQIVALADAYNERLAICLVDDIPEDEARRTAEAEIGAEFVRRFMPAEAVA